MRHTQPLAPNPNPRIYHAKINIAATRQMANAAQIAAENEGLTRSEWVRRLIHDKLTSLAELNQR